MIYSLKESITYENGDTYEGGFIKKNGKDVKNDFGVSKFKDGRRYEGELFVIRNKATNQFLSMNGFGFLNLSQSHTVPRAKWAIINNNNTLKIKNDFNKKYLAVGNVLELILETEKQGLDQEWSFEEIEQNQFVIKSNKEKSLCLAVDSSTDINKIVLARYKNRQDYAIRQKTWIIENLSDLESKLREFDKDFLIETLSLPTTTTTSTTTTTKVFSLLWKSDSNDRSIKRMSECEWEEFRSETSRSIYEFVDFNQQSGLYLYDSKKNLFLNINDKDYSVGKRIDDLITISNGAWQNFNQFGLSGIIFKNTENCEYALKKIGNIWFNIIQIS
jgi:hypothetical protein